MRKSFLARMTVAFLALSTVFGCVSMVQAEGADVSGEIHYAFWNSDQQPWLEMCVEEFNQIYPDVSIVLECTDWDEYWTKLEAAATGGSLADVFWMNGVNITKYARGGILMGIDELLEDSEIDLANYPDAMVEMYNIDGVQYAIPKDFDTIGVWYNRDLFDAAGIDYPTDDWSWEEMVETSVALTAEDGSVYGLAAPCVNQEGYYSTIPMFGGYVISEDKTTSGYDLDGTKAGIQCWVDLQELGVSPSEASLEENNSYDQFMSGLVAMCWAGSWRLPAFLESDVADSIDVVELPSVDGNKANVIHGLGNCIYAGTSNPEAAWAWVEFLGGETANVLSATTGTAIPALAGTAAEWVNAYPQYNLQSFITASEEYSVLYPGTANTAEWQQYETDALKLAFSLDVSVDDACAQAYEKINAVLAAE